MSAVHTAVTQHQYTMQRGSQQHCHVRKALAARDQGPPSKRMKPADLCHHTPTQAGSYQRWGWQAATKHSSRTGCCYCQPHTQNFAAPTKMKHDARRITTHPCLEAWIILLHIPIYLLMGFFLTHPKLPWCSPQTGAEWIFVTEYLKHNRLVTETLTQVSLERVAYKAQYTGTDTSYICLLTVLTTNLMTSKTVLRIKRKWRWKLIQTLNHGAF